MSEEVKVNRIGRDFTTFELLKYTFPAFCMNVFTQLFKSLDDALFVSKFVGEKALAALNLLNPIRSIQMGLGHLFSIGSANISARLMGEGDQYEAKQVFSRIVVSAFLVGGLFASIINIFAYPILTKLGADASLMTYSIYQVRFVVSIAPISLMNAVFSAYYSTSGKPKMGLICSLVNGFTNIILDVILVAYLKVGVIGVCFATSVGEIFVFIIGVSFFTNKKNEIYFVLPDGKYLSTSIESCKYALPQFINSLSISVTSLITNHLLLSMIGSQGVAANAIISDIRAIITSGLIGLASAVGPIISYNFGNKNPVRLKKILFSVLKIWITGSLCLMAVGFSLRNPLITLFMNENSTIDFYNMAYFGLTIEVFAVPFTSACVTMNRMFISLKNPKVATILSLCRHLIFKSIVLTILPRLFDTTGIWMAIPVTELFAFLLGAYFVIVNRNNYGYGKSGEARLIV